MRAFQYIAVCSLVVTGLVRVDAVQAQTTKPPSIGMMRRLQSMQQQQSKKFQQYQKQYAEWRVKAEAEMIKKQAEHKAELARRKAQLESDRQARSAKKKQHNEE